MQTKDNEGGGRTVFLREGDSLSRVPASHRALVTPAIRAAFADPVSHFRQIAKECPFPQMKAWLQALIKEKDWRLALHRGDPPEFASAGFDWTSSKVFGAEIAPAVGLVPPALPEPLQKYYSLVDSVHWMGFGLSGGLNGSNEQTPVSAIAPYLAENVDSGTTFVFGWSLGGDMLVYTTDNRAGWLCHENAQVHWLGTIEDTIVWVFGELLADRCPDFDYNWL